MHAWKDVLVVAVLSPALPIALSVPGLSSCSLFPAHIHSTKTEQMQHFCFLLSFFPSWIYRIWKMKGFYPLTLSTDFFKSMWGQTRTKSIHPPGRWATARCWPNSMVSAQVWIDWISESRYHRHVSLGCCGNGINNLTLRTASSSVDSAQLLWCTSITLDLIFCCVLHCKWCKRHFDIGHEQPECLDCRNQDIVDMPKNRFRPAVTYVATMPRMFHFERHVVGELSAG